MREFLNEELEAARTRLKEQEKRVLLALVPGDPLAGKNAIIEIRAGTGGDEAALFARDLFTMYARLAERKGYELVAATKANGIFVDHQYFALFGIHDNSVSALRSDESSVITFGDQPTPISQVFRWFLESQPKVIEFSELAPADADPDEPEIFAKLGVTSRLVEKHRGR